MNPFPSVVVALVLALVVGGCGASGGAGKPHPVRSAVRIRYAHAPTPIRHRMVERFRSVDSLRRWTRFDGDFAPAAVALDAGGGLRVTPSRSWWFREWRAFLLSRPVTGDFVVTARVRVTGKQSAKPTRDWSLSGLLVRSPGGSRARENWVSARVGVVNHAWVYERKTTRDSDSHLQLIPTAPGWHELRIRRHGPQFTLSGRASGRPWRTLARYRRPDLPRRLDIGIDAFSGSGDSSADLVGHIAWVRVTPSDRT